jgi:hypothetical protein
MRLNSSIFNYKKLITYININFTDFITIILIIYDHINAHLTKHRMLFLLLKGFNIIQIQILYVAHPFSLVI